MTDRKIVLAEMTVKTDSLSTQECELVEDYYQSCHYFQAWIGTKFQLTPIEAFWLAKILVENYHVLIQEDEVINQTVWTKVNQIKTKNPPDEVN